MEDKPLYPKLQEFLEKEWMKFYIANNGKVSQSDWAKKMGITPTDLSRYKNGMQMPSIHAQDKISEIVGPKIYQACGNSMRAPSDHFAIELFTEFWSELDSNERETLVASARQLVERKKKHKNLQP